MAVYLIGDKAMNTVVSHLGGVHAAVGAAAKVKYARASAKLAAHRHAGVAKVELEEGSVDWFVNFEDRAVLSIEYGHMVGGKFYDPDNPKYVPGLYILTGS